MSSFVSCILLLVSPLQASSSNQPACLGSICHCIFFPYGMCPDRILYRARQRWLPYFPGKYSSEIAGNGVSTTCCIPRHSMRKVAPLQLLRSFLIFFFFAQKIAAYVFKRFPGFSVGEIQFVSKVGVLKYKVVRI